MDQQKHKQTELKDVMKYEWMRLASFAEFPSSSPAHPTRLAKSGFYFQGNEDEVTCFRCGVKHKGWKPGDVAENVHRDVSPQCPFLKETDTANFGIKESPWKLTNGHVNALSVHDNNISPNIGNLGCNETVTNAVSGKSGKDDRVRCFFCGGGLFNWEENDDPWVEHARWFPKCVYLRQSKSDEFIYKVHQEVQRGITDFSHLKDYKPGHRTQTPSTSTTLDENGVLPSASVTSDKNDVMSHPAVISVLDMGTDKTLVKKAVETINKLNEKLLLKVWEIQDSGGTETVNNNNEQPTNGQTDEQLSNGTDIPGSADTKTDDEEAERLAIIEENRHLRELQLCKICLDEDVSIVFLPCGHMATCASCAPALRKCPICRQFIKGTVKAIIS
ncbi:hypothetical protein KUTeg_011305 [Tegillarca granosa]|uniref:RING-type domain-containing protein n=1 Tax=Tegillarca granosa TaxID=220873 RepID=A0ABQ9F4L2_TEGGR|nr:hypothetical protein KUTeg_011305 [Tegillarca granosa]